MLQTILLAAVTLTPGSIDIESELRGLYWLDADSTQVQTLEAGFLRLAECPLAELRDAIVQYLKNWPKTQISGGSLPDTHPVVQRAKVLRRSINVTVLNRLIFHDEMNLVSDQWFGIDITAPNTIWEWSTGKPRLSARQFASNLVLNHGYSSLREFDALVRARGSSLAKVQRPQRLRKFSVTGLSDIKIDE